MQKQHARASKGERNTGNGGGAGDGLLSRTLEKERGKGEVPARCHAAIHQAGEDLDQGRTAVRTEEKGEQGQVPKRPTDLVSEKFDQGTKRQQWEEKPGVKGSRGLGQVRTSDGLGEFVGEKLL